MKSHPLQAKFSDNPKKICLHAEVDAIINYLKAGFDVEKLADCTLYVARVKEVGNDTYKTGLAKPCSACQNAIIHYGFGDVIWTLD